MPEHSGLNPDEELELKRERLDQKLKSTFEAIFEKYEKSFDGIGDEVDLNTGEILVNNGHLYKMEDERDAGDVRSIGKSFEGAERDSTGSVEEEAIDEGAGGELAFEDESMMEDDMILRGLAQQPAEQVPARWMKGHQTPEAHGMTVTQARQESVLPSNSQIIAQFGPELGPRIVDYVAKQQTVEERSIESLWGAPNIPGISSRQRPVVKPFIHQRRSTRSVSPNGGRSIWALMRQPRSTRVYRASSKAKASSPEIPNSSQVGSEPEPGYDPVIQRPMRDRRPAQKDSTIISWSQAVASIEALDPAEHAGLLADAKGIKSLSFMPQRALSVDNITTLPSSIPDSQHSFSALPSSSANIPQKSSPPKARISEHLEHRVHSSTKTGKKSVFKSTVSRRASLPSLFSRPRIRKPTAVARRKFSNILSRLPINPGVNDLDELSLGADDCKLLFSRTVPSKQKPTRQGHRKSEVSSKANITNAVIAPQKEKVRCNEIIETDEPDELGAEDPLTHYFVGHRNKLKSVETPAKGHLSGVNKQGSKRKRVETINGSIVESEGPATPNAETRKEEPSKEDHINDALLLKGSDMEVSTITTTTSDSRSNTTTKKVSTIDTTATRGSFQDCLMPPEPSTQETINQGRKETSLNALSPNAQNAQFALNSTSPILRKGRVKRRTELANPISVINQAQSSTQTSETGPNNVSTALDRASNGKWTGTVSSSPAIQHQPTKGTLHTTPKKSSFVVLVTPARVRSERSNTPLLDVLTPLSQRFGISKSPMAMGSETAPGGTRRRCGKHGFSCGRQFCFRCSTLSN